MYKYEINRLVGKEDQQVYEKCADIRKAVRSSKKNVDIHDYPSVAVGCYTSYHQLFINTTDSRPNYSQTPSLQKALQAIGQIGTKRTQCKYRIGWCAEPKAAFCALSLLNCGLRLLKFTTAYRPRTGEKKKYCRNCKEIFSL